MKELNLLRNIHNFTDTAIESTNIQIFKWFKHSLFLSRSVSADRMAEAEDKITSQKYDPYYSRAETVFNTNPTTHTHTHQIWRCDLSVLNDFPHFREEGRDIELQLLCAEMLEQVTSSNI